MTGGETSSKLFLSCVSDEFGKREAPYGEARQILSRYLRRAKCQVETQEDFPQDEADTLEKLDKFIRSCRAVVHVVGALPGSVASGAAVTRLLKKLELEGRPFLSGQPEALRDSLGDFSGLTYTKWEAFLALHHGVSLFVYGAEAGDEAQANHLERLIFLGLLC